MKKIISLIITILAVVGCGITQDTREAQVIYGQFCCDGGGVRRCILNTPLPIGSGCFCYGQGNGYTCL